MVLVQTTETLKCESLLAIETSATSFLGNYSHW